VDEMNHIVDSENDVMHMEMSNQRFSKRIMKAIARMVG